MAYLENKELHPAQLTDQQLQTLKEAEKSLNSASGIKSAENQEVYLLALKRELQ